MIGLIFLAIIGLYLMVVISAPFVGVRIAKVFNAPPGAVRLSALAAFLAVTLPIFWDWIPTVVAHNHYCKRDAGVFIYKTVEQWKAENPGVAKALSADYKKDSQDIDGGRRYFINERHVWDVKNRRHSWGIREREDSIVDLKANEVLALHRDYSTGVTASLVGGNEGLRAWKLWMNYGSCEPGDPDPSKRHIEKKFRAALTGFEMVGEKK